MVNLVVGSVKEVTQPSTSVRLVSRRDSDLRYGPYPAAHLSKLCAGNQGTREPWNLGTHARLVMVSAYLPRYLPTAYLDLPGFYTVWVAAFTHFRKLRMTDLGQLEDRRVPLPTLP